MYIYISYTVFKKQLTSYISYHVYTRPISQDIRLFDVWLGFSSPQAPHTRCKGWGLDSLRSLLQVRLLGPLLDTQTSSAWATHNSASYSDHITNMRPLRVWVCGCEIIVCCIYVIIIRETEGRMSNSFKKKKRRSVD
jgi:hypothetical protein